MNQLLIASKLEEDIQKEIKAIIDNISNQHYFEDEEIENDLKGFIEQLDDDNRRQIVQQLHQLFPEEKFLKLSYFQKISIKYNMNQQQTLEDHTQKYLENLKAKKFDQILKEITNEDYCKQNMIPFYLKDYLVPLNKLKNQDLDLIFQLIEGVKHKRQPNFIWFLKLLINLFFLQCDNEIKGQIHQLIGSLLENQIYKFEYYVAQIIQNEHIKPYFIDCIYKVQSKDISAKQGKEILFQSSKDKQILFLFELFTLKLGSHADNLTGFIKNLIYLKDSKINKDDLIQYVSLTENFNENLDYLYFKLVFYFWIQFIEIFKLKESIQDFENRLSKSQTKRQVLERGITNLNSKEKNMIYRYLIKKILYYSNLEDLDFENAYNQYQAQEKEFIKKFSLFKSTNIEKLKEVAENSKQFMFYQLKFLQSQQQDFTKEIHILTFLATNDLNNNLETTLTEKIKTNFTDCNIKEFDNFTKEYQINLLHLQQSLKNKIQIKMSRFVNQNEIYNQYPKQLMIKMEEFNISLTSKNQMQQIVDEWLKDKTNKKNFKQLLPYYFNIIKRRESAEELLSLMNKNVFLKQESSRNEAQNLKSLFQILYNNSDRELQMILLKIHSKSHPVPLLYQNPYLEKQITSIKDFYILNSNIFYLLSNDFPMINFSLSQKSNQFGKSELINMIFYIDYKDQKFEISDSSSINNNSVDCQFDFSFNGSRNYLIADVHGQLENEILQELLPFFQLWIIQMQKEDEFEENVDNLIVLCENMRLNIKPKILLIIRDSENKELNQEKICMLKKKEFDFQIYQIPNLQRQVNKAIEKDERAKIKEFILKQIGNKNETIKENQIQESFLLICKAFNVNENEIRQSQEILNDLTNELNNIIQKEDGFYSSEAFPIRNLIWREKTQKQQRQQLNYTKHQYEQELEKKQNAINDIKNERNNDLTEKLKQKENEKLEIESKIKQTEVNLLQIANEISNIEDQKQKQNFNESRLIKQFSLIFTQDNYYITYLRFVEHIAIFNQKNVKDLNIKKENLRQQLDSLMEEQKTVRADIEEKLKILENKYKFQNMNIELFWREVIKGNNSFNQSPINIVCQLIKKGEPFEFLNGDDLTIDSNFLIQLREKLLDKDDNKILFLSILGPQSSGKSTLLNRIFGCHFLTSMGRCTKGLFLQLLKISNKEQFQDSFDYILLLDSEGLQNPNQKDPEFDKKISLFIIQISDILIFNVKGEIHSTFHNLIEVSFYTLAKYSRLKFKKQFSWCFNQNSQINGDEKFKLLTQIEDIGKKLNSENNLVDEDDNKIDYVKHLDITQTNIYILGMATNSQEWQKYHNSNQNSFQEIKQEINLQDYSKNALSFGIDIINKFINKYKKEQSNHHEILTWNAFITKVQQCWEIVSKLPDLVEFSDLKEQKDYEVINKIATEKMTKANEHFQDFELIVEQIQSKCELNNSLENYNQIQKDVQKDFLQQCNYQKEEILSQLQQEYSYSIISDSISKKVIGNITEVFQAISFEGCLIIVQKINQLRRQYQFSLVPTKIQQTLNEILRDSEQLQILQDNISERNKKFELLWKQLVESSNQEVENLRADFQKKLFECFLQYKKQYIYKAENLNDQIDFFVRQINIQDPNEQKETQLEKICSLFLKDFQQNSFNTLNKQSKQQLQLIFNEDILKRIEKMPQSPFIDPWKYFEKVTTFNVIKKQEIVEQLKSNLKKHLIEIIKENKEEKQRQLEIQELFKSLDYLPIQFDQQTLKEVQDLIQEKFCQFQEILIAHDQENILQSVQIEQLQSENQNTSSYLNFQSNQIQQNISDVQRKYFIIDDLINSLKVSQSKQIIYSSIHYIQQRVRGIKFQKEIKELNDNEKRQYLILQENVSIKFKQSTHNQMYQILFNYIISQQNNDCDSENFQQQFPSIFKDIMTENQGWKKLCSNIYDIIQSQFYETQSTYPKPQQTIPDILQIISIDEDVTKYNRQLVQRIMKKVEKNLEQINKELAFFGIEFSQLFIRKLQFYSCFIIWRFICYDKMKMDEKEQMIFQKNRVMVRNKYENTILKNKQKESKDQGKQQAMLLYKLCIMQFYKENKINVKKYINLHSKTSFQLIKELDQQLLIISKQNTIKQINIDIIIEYITDQTGFMKKYIEQLISNLKQDIENQLDIQHSVQISLNLIIDNAKILLDRNKVLLNNQSQQFLNCSQDLENQNLSLDYIFKYILGQDVGKVEQNSYKQLFQYDQNIKQVNLPIEQILQREEISVQFLDTFLEEFITQVSNLFEESKTLKTSIEEFQFIGQFEEMKNIMNGCDQSCPTCNRKCDCEFYQEKDHKHKCSNGHQLRGMNKILIRNSPSLFTCEEIVDDAEIQIEETCKFKTWREIKAYYKNWSFMDILKAEDLQQNKQKMIEIWNGGIGQQICEVLSKELKQQIQYQQKHDLPMNLQHGSTHYIFILDDSGSMCNLWKFVIKCVESQFQQICRKRNARVSVVIFNTTARVVIKCEELRIEEQLKLITYKSGGTDYGPAFQQTLELLKENPEFDNSVILFYTDGLAQYPSKEIEQYLEISKRMRDTIYFLACSQPTKSPSLDQILNFFKKEYAYSEWRDKIEPSSLNKNWAEMISQAHLDKYKA